MLPSVRSALASTASASLGARSSFAWSLIAVSRQSRMVWILCPISRFGSQKSRGKRPLSLWPDLGGDQWRCLYFNSKFTVLAGLACHGSVMREPFPYCRSFGADTGFEMMTRNKAEKGERLAAEVRRQFGAEAMTRFLRTLPAFRIE